MELITTGLPPPNRFVIERVRIIGDKISNRHRTLLLDVDSIIYTWVSPLPEPWLNCTELSPLWIEIFVHIQ